MTKVCTFYLRGECRFGKRCCKYHPVLKPLTNPVNNAAESSGQESIQVQCDEIVKQIQKLQLNLDSLISNQNAELDRDGATGAVINEVTEVASKIKVFDEKINTIKQKLGFKFPGVAHLLHEDDVDDALECPMCMEVYMTPIMLDCSHIFCKWCIYSWARVQNHCPTCRKRVTNMTYCTELDRIIKKAIEKGPKKFKDDYESVKNTRDREGLRVFYFEEDLYRAFIRAQLPDYYVI